LKAIHNGEKVTLLNVTVVKDHYKDTI